MDAPIRGHDLLSAGGAVLSEVPPATARDVEDARMSPHEPAHHRTYRPIPGNNPETLLHRPEDCRSALYCDVIDVEMAVPQNTEEDRFREVHVTLT